MQLAHRSLEDYLVALKECPEIIEERPSGNPTFPNSTRKIHKLTSELGIHDNYPIVLQAVPEEVVREFLASPSDVLLLKYSHDRTYEKERNGLLPGTGNIQNTFDSALGTGLQIWDIAAISWIIGKSNHFSGDAEQYLEQLLQDFKTTILLHWRSFGSSRKIEGISWERVMATTVIDIAGYAQKRGFAICLPESIGWDHKGDLSRMVFYNPQ